eukprot:Gregarina_sp_Poly_1__6446@NODE_3446_length_1094_cov_20_235638_g2182_i0_p1_GENE_NODE_3446_length_1094_cov_20_235638_g2182_i0NODE_3446_length_1094_cov_20_235638_g2182_i0_p1_ORF_typecomplete_len136_score6_58_NODE_3446_length_1094_cov_20_235638_g2182_i06031010
MKTMTYCLSLECRSGRSSKPQTRNLERMTPQPEILVPATPTQLERKLEVKSGFFTRFAADLMGSPFLRTSNSNAHRMRPTKLSITELYMRNWNFAGFNSHEEFMPMMPARNGVNGVSYLEIMKSEEHPTTRLEIQ